MGLFCIFSAPGEGNGGFQNTQPGPFHSRACTDPQFLCTGPQAELSVRQRRGHLAEWERLVAPEPGKRQTPPATACPGESLSHMGKSVAWAARPRAHCSSWKWCIAQFVVGHVELSSDDKKKQRYGQSQNNVAQSSWPQEHWPYQFAGIQDRPRFDMHLSLYMFVLACKGCPFFLFLFLSLK